MVYKTTEKLSNKIRSDCCSKFILKVNVHLSKLNYPLSLSISNEPGIPISSEVPALV